MTKAYIYRLLMSNVELKKIQNCFPVKAIFKKNEYNYHDIPTTMHMIMHMTTHIKMPDITVMICL